MAIIISIFKLASIPCMLTFICLLLMTLGFIPSKRIIKFLRMHEKVQVAFAIMCGIGVISSFIAVTF